MGQLHSACTAPPGRAFRTTRAPRLDTLPEALIAGEAPWCSGTKVELKAKQILKPGFSLDRVMVERPGAFERYGYAGRNSCTAPHHGERGEAVTGQRGGARELVESRRSLRGARADERHPRRLESSLQRAILAERAVQSRERDGAAGSEVRGERLQAVAVRVAFESKLLKPVIHVIGSIEG
jgi:hypothetical protein